MRYKFNEIAPSGKRQYFIALGYKDLEILHGLTVNACRNMPSLNKNSNAEYAEIYNRLRSMRRAMAHAITEAEILGDDNKRRKVNTLKRTNDTFTAEDIINEDYSENEA